MTREWKPGDNIPDGLKVVLPWNGVALAKALSVLKEHYGPGYHALADDLLIATTRPLVVIDPEDHEQVERLTGALVYAGAGKNDDNHWREVQAALRELAEPKPPKPEEPTGLGAVVEDSNGDKWVRIGPRIADFDWLNAKDPDRSRAWRNVAAVRVLSEGVTA